MNLVGVVPYTFSKLIPSPLLYFETRDKSVMYFETSLNEMYCVCFSCNTLEYSSH